MVQKSTFERLFNQFKKICDDYESLCSEPLALEAHKTRLGLALFREGPLAISDLSRILGISHPAVLSIARAMIQKEWIADYRDRRDKRRRLLALTNLGTTVFIGISAHDSIRTQVLNTLSEEVGLDKVLTRLEQSLLDTSLEARVRQQRSDIQILPYDDAHKFDFERLNRAWIERDFQLEPEDLRIFSDPRGEIIQPGGEILVAVSPAGEVVGTCALIKNQDNHGELAKMAVHHLFQGLGIGRRLGQAIITRAQQMGLERVTLESNHRLKPAITLYETLGFKPVAVSPDSEFARADISMVLILSGPNQ